MPKQSSVRCTGKVRLNVRNGRFVKYTNNRINSAERYAWYLNSKHTALGEINSTRICAFPLKHILNILFRRIHPTTGRWPLPRGPLWCDYVVAGRVWWVASGEGLITVIQLMHSECGCIAPPPGRWRGGPYKRGTTV